MNASQESTILGLLDSISNTLDELDIVDDDDPTEFTDEVQILIDKYKTSLRDRSLEDVD